MDAQQWDGPIQLISAKESSQKHLASIEADLSLKISDLVHNLLTLKQVGGERRMKNVSDHIIK